MPPDATLPHISQDAAKPLNGLSTLNGQTHVLHPIYPPARVVRTGRGVQQAVQAAALQRFAFDAGMALQRDLTKNGILTVTRDDAMALSQLLRAWDTAADRLRVLRGKGLPASVRSKPSKSTAQVEPIEPV